MTAIERHEDELPRLLDEQSALRRVATLVAAGSSDEELAVAVGAEIGVLFGAQAANVLRWDGETLRVVGEWNAQGRSRWRSGSVFQFGGDTITARVVGSGGPARVDSAADLKTAFGRARWQELGIEASIGAPIVLDGQVWGVITASRRTPDDPFPPGAEAQLADFAALVATSIANSQARREVAELAEEQAALRRVAMLVAAGRPQTEVVEAIGHEVGQLYDAAAVHLVRSERVLDKVVVVGGWSGGSVDCLTPGSLYRPASGSATLHALETGRPCRTEEDSPLLFGYSSVIAAPVIVEATLRGALTAVRPSGEPFPAGTEVRLRSFGDLAAQAIANEEARETLRASRARIVRASDDARQTLERNLHDGAQQRLVAVSIQLRLALARLDGSPEDARTLLTGASEELTHAIDDLRELARGLHPAILTERGLGPALEVLARRTPLRVAVTHDLHERLPPPVEAAVYYVVAESLTNVAKYAQASSVQVRVSQENGTAFVEVRDDGVGGADVSRGTGLRGLADRVEALDGRLGVDSPPAAGTRVWAEIPLRASS
jgi:signal transduction histidine kinase